MLTDTHPKMANVNMSDDPIKEHELNAITSDDSYEDQTGSDVENVLGSVHISKPSIQHVFFLLRPILKPILEQFNKLERELHELVNAMKIERTFLDNRAALSTNVGYTCDYRGRKFLYLYTSQTLTLGLSGGGAITAGANVWTPLTFPTGTIITASGISDANPVGVTVRACDAQMALFAELISGGASIGNVALLAGTANIGNVGFTGDYPNGANIVTATSGNVANAVATATLAAAAGKVTYLTGFEITGSGATGALVVTVTVVGSGTLASYTYTFVAGATLANQPLIVEFTHPLSAGAVNTTIVVSCPASGLGGTNNVVNAHGYQL